MDVVSQKISIVMPVRNETKRIQPALDSVLSQDYPKDLLEIIVADGISEDGTGKILEEYQSHCSFLKVIQNPKKIVSTGLNVCISQARGNIIIRMDGHTVIAPDYVRQCVAVLQRTGADNVGGKMSATGENMFGEAVALATSCRFGIGNSKFHYSDREEWVDTVYLGAWRKETFDKIGLFDEELVRNQDDEFNYRLLEAGGRILLSPEIKSKYIARGSVTGLWSQYFQYGFWKVRVMQKHPRRMKMRHFAPPLFAAGILIAAAAALFLNSTPLAAILLIYGSASLIASALIAFQKGGRYFLLLPVVFFILHFSYGLGFLCGLVRFAGRWRNS